MSAGSLSAFDTDALIVGAGPAGLFAAFQLGLFDISCVIVDAAPAIGGQCSAFYSDKQIYDAPGFPSIMAGELVERLYLQAGRPNVRLNISVESIEAGPTGRFMSRLSDRNALHTRIVILGNGGGIIGSQPKMNGAHIDGPLAVDAKNFMTSHEGVFAIGDAATYPGKLPLILSAFHEAALMTQAVRAIVPRHIGRKTLRRRNASSQR